MSNIAAIILGRKGSKGVKDKNTMIIEGIPSYEYSFLAAQNSKFINQVFVSSDHDDILNAAIEKNSSQLRDQNIYLQIKHYSKMH